MIVGPAFKGAIAASVSGFLTRPCCIVPAAMSLAGVGSARLSSALATYRFEFLLASGVLLGASLVVNVHRDGGWFNKVLSVLASMMAFAVAAGWLGGGETMRRLVAIMSVFAIFGTGLLAQKSADRAPGTVCTLKITGMACSACTNTVEKAAKKVPGVTAAKADQPSGSAAITFDPAKTSPEAIAKAITAKTPFKAEVDKAK